MNPDTPSRLRNGKLLSKIPILGNSNLTPIRTMEMSDDSNSQTNSQAELVEAHRNLETRFENLNSEITELKSLLNTLVKQNNASKQNANEEPQPRRYYTTSTDKY